MGEDDKTVKRIDDDEEFTHRGGTLYVDSIGARAVVWADNLVVGKEQDVNSKTTPVIGEGARVYINDVKPKKNVKNTPSNIHITGNVTGCVLGDNSGTTIKSTFVDGNLVETTISDGNPTNTSDDNLTTNSFNELTSSTEPSRFIRVHGIVGKGVVIDTLPMSDDGLTPSYDVDVTALDEGGQIIGSGDITVGGVYKSKIQSFGGNIAAHTAEGAHMETDGAGKIEIESMAVSGSKLYTEHGDISAPTMDSSSEAITFSGNIDVKNPNGARIEKLNKNTSFIYD